MNDKEIFETVFHKTLNDDDFHDVILENQNTWKKHSRMWGDKMHRICSYVAMFPPTLANYFIEKYSDENDIVLDTFSGRGTTLLEARIANRRTYAIDLNPFAYVLSRSKAQPYDLAQVVDRINQWEEHYYQNEESFKLDKTLRVYYSKRNLTQLSFIKETYGRHWKELDDIDNFILAITLGLMHGPMRKNGESLYFSLSMSNCISMSRNYVKNYARKNKLRYPKDNVFKKIRERACEFLTKAQSNDVDNRAHVFYGNSLEINSYFDDLKAKLIFTSPPYLNIVNYTQQNWIKMWLLGYETKTDNKEIRLDDHHKIDEYIIFMAEYLHAVAKIMNESSTLALVIGDVKENNATYSFDDMWNNHLKFQVHNLTLTEIYTDEIDQNKKATNSMGKKAGKATRVDKIYIFKKMQ